MPQAELKELLAKVDGEGHATMDCSIVQSQKYPDLFVVSTVDFFYPLVEDPYWQGRIAACNVLSDMYSMGIDVIDNVLMCLAVSDVMDKKTQMIVTEKMMRGFGDVCKEAGCEVTGGQTIINPAPIIGGVAKSVLKEKDFIRPEHAVPGDVLVLTKALGTQVAVNMREWMYPGLNPGRKEKLLEVITEEDERRTFAVAQASMARLNKTGAELMHKHGAHAATDVTGFGILGHGQNLAENQRECVRFVLHTLPCVGVTARVAKELQFTTLLTGYSAETSGGLLLALPRENAQAYCDEILERDGWPAWIVGEVEAADTRGAVLAEELKIIEM